MSKTIYGDELTVLGTNQARRFVEIFLEKPETWGITFYQQRSASEFEYNTQ